MAIFDASGTAIGTSAASAAAIVEKFGVPHLGGTAALSAQAGVLQLSNASFQGSSIFDWDYFIEAAGTVAGTSAASADANIVHTALAVFPGSSLFLYSIPFVIAGTSFFSVAPQVDHQLLPVKAITMGPKTFRWLQPLQRGDLSVFICDGRSPVIPARIFYRLAQVRIDGTKKYVGPQERSPVPGVVGEFYASGRAGESGQPGLWVIEWVYQRTYQSDLQVTEMQFQVLDAVAINDPRELLVRKTKYGWS